jgi:hypothetical protein
MNTYIKRYRRIYTFQGNLSVTVKSIDEYMGDRALCVMRYRDYLYFSVVPESTFPVALPYTSTSTFRYFLKSIDSLYTSPSTFVLLSII